MEYKMKNVSNKKALAVKILAGAMAFLLVAGAIALPIMYILG